MAALATQPRRGARPRTALLIALPAALILLGSLMRAPVLLAYQGPLTAHALNVDLMAHVGAYSDISHLFFRDHIGAHPMPYFDFRFEYPVLTGLFVWVASFVHSSVAAYFFSSTVLLLGLGLATVWVLSRINGANPWLFAAAPALALYGTLNWDLLGICLLVIALLLFQRGRDGFAAGGLALATCAKFFPIVVLPIVLALRLAEGRRRARRRLSRASSRRPRWQSTSRSRSPGQGRSAPTGPTSSPTRTNGPRAGRSGTPCSGMQRTWWRCRCSPPAWPRL